MSPSEKIFLSVSPNEFKIMGNNILNNIGAALLQEETIIDKNRTPKIKEILTKYQNDPIEASYVGTTHTLMKIRRYFYWLQMTKTFSKYVKECLQCGNVKSTARTKI